jgi:superfamily II DNA or RNA helicase
MGPSALHAVVGGTIWFDRSRLPLKALARIERRLTFPNPEYVSRVRFGRWTGATPEEITLMTETSDGILHLPRGAVGVLREVLATTGQSICFEDRRITRAMEPVTVNLHLRDYQSQAVTALVNHLQGCVVIPCGGGKTVVGAAAIAEINQTAIIIVHTRDLLEQWSAALRSMLGIVVGTVTEGVVSPSEVTVATVQTLIALERPELTSLGERFGVVIVDEAHHTPASTFREVLAAFPGRYRFGLTATPERPDGLSPLLDLCIGPSLYQTDHKALMEAGHLVIPVIESVMTGCAPEAETHAAILNELVSNETRNERILRLAAGEARQGATVLILSGRVAHCQYLAEALRRRGLSAAALTGGVAKRNRASILDGFRTGDIQVVCATSLADEGLDVATLDRLILATPARAEARTIQRLGRLMRPHPGKRTPILYDLVDDCPMAHRQWLARRRAYKKVLRGVTPAKGDRR